MVYEKNESMEHLWNDNNCGKPINRADNLSQCHYLPQMPRGVSRERLATNQLSYAMCYWDIYTYIFPVYMNFVKEKSCMNTEGSKVR